MTDLTKLLMCAALAAATATATGCGDDTTGSGSGGAGGAGTTGSSGDGGGSSTNGPTTGPTSTSSGDTSSPASSGTTAPTSSSSGGTCGSGDGTPEELGAAYRDYCEIASDLAGEVCGGEDQLQACLDLESLVVQASAGCEAEQTAFFACINPIFDTVDPASCNCDGGQLACPGVDPNACAAEEAAAEACDACNG